MSWKSVRKFIWKKRKKLFLGPKAESKQTDYLPDPRPSYVHHEWAVLWELWRGAGWSWGDATGPKGEQAAHHSSHAQIQNGLPRRIPKDLSQRFPTWVSSKLPAALQKADDEPQHQPAEAPLHPGPHAQVESRDTVTGLCAVVTEWTRHVSLLCSTDHFQLLLNTKVSAYRMSHKTTTDSNWYSNTQVLLTDRFYEHLNQHLKTDNSFSAVLFL